MKRSSESSNWLSFNLFDANLLFKVHKNIFLFYLLIFLRCAGSSLLHGLSSNCGERDLVHQLLLLQSTGSRAHRLHQLRLPRFRAQAQQLWYTGLAAPWHVGSYQTGVKPVSPAGQENSLPLGHPESLRTFLLSWMMSLIKYFLNE